ncbi:MAG: tetratricopeptide repeat protein, partial [Deltaproteobacteria bacterium]|nr:tetratricopeptide repeat protein [Deltaproteobacteria bacterium]
MNVKTVLVILLQIGLICIASPLVAWGQEQCELLSVEKHDEVNISRLSLQFNRLPEFQVKTSGQRLEVLLPETHVSSQLSLPPEDERLVRVLIGQAQKKMMLSFLLRRPPYFVNSVKNVQDRRLVIDLHWRDSQRGTRPAISRSVPGQTSVQSGGGVAGRAISSKYHGDWLRFFAEYERPVTLSAPINYTLAPFPCLSLVDDVSDVLPLDVAALADQGEWDEAITALEYVGLEAERGDAPLRLMLVKADLHQRAGNYRKARRFLDRITALLKERQQQLGACVSLQRLYLAINQANSPFELLAQKYIDLFQAEVLISAGDVRQTLPILEGALIEGVGELEPIYRQRLADVAYLRGNYKGAIDQYSPLVEQLDEQPFSLAGYATSLYRDKQYDATIAVAKKLLETLDDANQRDLVRYLMGLALINRGDVGAGYDLLHQILPGTIGSVLAQAKIADLGIQADDFFSRRRSLKEFESLIDVMPTRSGRAEMQFKHAVAMYLMGHRMAAINELQHF